MAQYIPSPHASQEMQAFLWNVEPVPTCALWLSGAVDTSCIICLVQSSNHFQCLWWKNEGNLGALEANPLTFSRAVETELSLKLRFPQSTCATTTPPGCPSISAPV